MLTDPADPGLTVADGTPLNEELPVVLPTEVPGAEPAIEVPKPAVPAALPPKLVLPAVAPPEVLPKLDVLFPVVVVPDAGEAAFGIPDVPPPPVKSVPELPTLLGAVVVEPIVPVVPVVPVAMPPPAPVELTPWAQTGELLSRSTEMKRTEDWNKFL